MLGRKLLFSLLKKEAIWRQEEVNCTTVLRQIGTNTGGGTKRKVIMILPRWVNILQYYTNVKDQQSHSLFIMAVTLTRRNGRDFSLQ